MNNDQTEEKLKIENEITALKREYKYALDNLTRVKSDTNDIIAVKDRVTGEIADRQTDLTKIINEISSEKLTWATKRHEELTDLENKQAEVQNILKRKAELSEQEETIRQLEANDIEIRNEMRRLELKLEADKTAIAAQKREVEEAIKKSNDLIEVVQSEQEEFKKRVQKILKEVDKL